MCDRKKKKTDFRFGISNEKYKKKLKKTTCFFGRNLTGILP